MTAWLYILAFVRTGTTEARFEHKVVMASDYEEAIRAGYRVAKAAGILPPPEGEAASPHAIQLVAP